MASTTVSANNFNTALKQIAEGIVWKDSYSAAQAEIDSYYFQIDRYISAAQYLMTKYSTSYINNILSDHLSDTTDTFAEFAAKTFTNDKERSSFETMQAYVEHNAYYRMLFGLPAEENGEKYYVYPDGYYNTSRLVMQHCKFPIDTASASLTLKTNDDFDTLINEVRDPVTGEITLNGSASYGDYIYVISTNSLYIVTEASELNIRSGDNIDSFGTPYSSGCSEIKPVLIPVHGWSYYDRSKWMTTSQYTAFLSDNTDKEYRYLKYMGSRHIYPYTARLSERFSLLYCPASDPEILADDFKDSYEKCRMYIIRVFYTDAFRGSQGTYYEGFIGMAILFMAMNQMYYKYLNADIGRDFYDLESLKVVYEAYGVPFYDNIPIKYHKRVIKKINELIKYKGCEKIFVDLCNIFDYDILGIYQYYLVKERKYNADKIPITAWTPQKDASGKVIYNNDGSPSMGLDYSRMYDYYFLKCNIEEDPYSQIMDNNNLEAYEKIAVPDDYWFDSDPDTIKTVQESEYNYIETKYIGVQVMFDITEMLYESSYFMRMILDNKKLSTELSVHHDRLDIEVNLFDLIIYLFALICKKNGYEGSIPSTPSSIARIYGFNFKGIFQKLKETSLQGLHIKKDFDSTNSLDELNSMDRKLLTRDLVSSGYGKTAKSNGIVDSVTSNEIHLKYEDGTTDTVTLYGDNDSTIFKTNLVSGSIVSAGDLVAYSDDSHLIWHGDYIKPNELTSWMSLNEWLQSSTTAKETYNSCVTLLNNIENYVNGTASSSTSAANYAKAYLAMKDLLSLLDKFLLNSEDRLEYNAFQQLRKIITTTELIDSVYTYDDGGTTKTASTYSELLKARNIDLYMSYEDLSGDELNTELDFSLIMLQKICDDLKYIQYIDSVDIDIITEYLYKLLRFFKSAKVDLIDFNLMFTFSSRTENSLKLLDWINSTKSKVYIDEDFAYWLYTDTIDNIASRVQVKDKEFIFQFNDYLRAKSRKIFLADSFHNATQVLAYSDAQYAVFNESEKANAKLYGFMEYDDRHELMIPEDENNAYGVSGNILNAGTSYDASFSMEIGDSASHVAEFSNMTHIQSITIDILDPINERLYIKIYKDNVLIKTINHNDITDKNTIQCSINCPVGSIIKVEAQSYNNGVVILHMNAYKFFRSGFRDLTYSEYSHAFYKDDFSFWSSNDQIESSIITGLKVTENASMTDTLIKKIESVLDNASSLPTA